MSKAAKEKHTLTFVENDHSCGKTAIQLSGVRFDLHEYLMCTVDGHKVVLAARFMRAAEGNSGPVLLLTSNVAKRITQTPFGENRQAPAQMWRSILLSFISVKESFFDFIVFNASNTFIYYQFGRQAPAESKIHTNILSQPRVCPQSSVDYEFEVETGRPWV